MKLKLFHLFSVLSKTHRIHVTLGWIYRIVPVNIDRSSIHQKDKNILPLKAQEKIANSTPLQKTPQNMLFDCAMYNAS